MTLIARPGPTTPHVVVSASLQTADTTGMSPSEAEAFVRSRAGHIRQTVHHVANGHDLAVLLHTLNQSGAVYSVLEGDSKEKHYDIDLNPTLRASR